MKRNYHKVSKISTKKKTETKSRLLSLKQMRQQKLKTMRMGR